MKPRRVYHPSATHLALSPPREIIECASPTCKVRFEARPESVDGQDDPGLCLTCNRAKWSRLWHDNRLIGKRELGIDHVDRSEDRDHDHDHDLSIDRISDSDIGEVVPIRRPRK